MMLGFDYWLTQLLFYIVPHTDFFNTFFLFFSAIGDYAIVWFVALIILTVLEEARRREFIIFFLIGLAATFFFATYVIKPSVKRVRPLYSVWNNESHVQKLWAQHPHDKPVDYSFPSVHTATSFFAAAFLSSFHKKYRLYFYMIAGIISYSRIYVGVHYFGDVIFGMLMGLVISHVVLSLAKVHKKIEKIRKTRRKR